MPNGPIRRAQLISPFGVGALYVGRDGISLISSGLDHWYKRENDAVYAEDDIEEFQFGEWRLERSLQVDHFRKPADYRRPANFQLASVPNRLFTHPFLRFPTWHFCSDPRCRGLVEMSLTVKGRLTCDAPTHNEGNNKRPKLFQVPYVAICPSGHIQDFPWKEWVHRDPDAGNIANDAYNHKLKLISRGMVGLGSEQIVCECGKRRNLATVLNSDKTTGTGLLSQSISVGRENDDLDDGQEYLCSGQKPWLGTKDRGTCGEPLSGSLRGSSNVYFAHVMSSIYVPRGDESTGMTELVGNIENPKMLDKLNTLLEILGDGTVADKVPKLVPMVRKEIKGGLPSYDDAQIEEALGIVLNPGGVTGDDAADEESLESFLRAEFNVLRAPKKEHNLEVRASPVADYAEIVPKYFERIMLIDKLKETRALFGFSRVFEDTPKKISELKEMFRLRPPDFSRPQENWLPANEVFGEGILLELQEPLVKKWEADQRIRDRLDVLIQRHDDAQIRRHAQPRPVSRRLVLIHTLSHVLINALTFQCGYSAAALRERLYVSEDDANPMAGVLIYTASGDADGTMGGLVRMGTPGFLEPIIESAIGDSRWCSADPVCMEIGASAGQGPDSCNLAACHNCALVPETSCEVFNKLLDRATLIGDLEDQSLGFFS